MHRAADPSDGQEVKRGCVDRGPGLVEFTIVVPVFVVLAPGFVDVELESREGAADRPLVAVRDTDIGGLGEPSRRRGGLPMWIHMCAEMNNAHAWRRGPWVPSQVVVLSALAVSVLAASVVVWLAVRGVVVLAVLVGPVAALVGLGVARKRRWVLARQVVGTTSARFEAIIEASPDLVILVTGDGEILYRSEVADRVSPEAVLARILQGGELSGGGLVDLVGRPQLVELADDGPVLKVEVRDERRNPDVGAFVVFGRDCTDEEELRKRLERQASLDELTGLPNRRAAEAAVNRAVARARRAGKQMGLGLIDLDGFKGVNDTLGHPFGDRLLAEVGERLRDRVRGAEGVARLGGDEFAIVFEHLEDAGQAVSAVERLLDAVREPYELGDQLLTIGASAGVAVSGACESFDDVFRKADLALYEAKKSEGSTVELFRREFADLLADEARMADAMSEGFAAGEFSLVYQPIVSLETFEPVGVEALMRWSSSALGEVEPATFIPIAERSGLIVDLGSWALEEACRQLREWSDTGSGREMGLTMSVNVSPRQLCDSRFAQSVGECLERWNVEPSLLQIEVTETSALEDIVGATKVLGEIRALGVQIALDDFGTGYSNLGQLQGLPVDCIKIDQEFLRKAAEHPDARSVLRALIEFGRRLDVRMIAEGVERESELADLVEPGCEHAQGFLFSRPMEPGDVARYLEQVVGARAK